MSLFSSFNPVVSAVLRSRLHWPLSIGLAEIAVVGRRSGRRYSFPVGYQWDDGDIVILVSDAPSKRWWRNYRDPWPMELLLGGRWVTGTGCTIPPDSSEFVEVCESTMRRVPGLSRIFGVVYSRAGGLDEAQRERLRQSVVAIRVALDRSSS